MLLPYQVSSAVGQKRSQQHLPTLTHCALQPQTNICFLSSCSTGVCLYTLIFPLACPFQRPEWPSNSNSRSAYYRLQGKNYSANSSHESFKDWWKYSLLRPPSSVSGNRSHHSLECSRARRMKLQVKTSHNKIKVEQLSLEIVLEKSHGTF